SDEQQRSCERNLLVLNHACERHERGEPATIVGDPWRKQLLVTFDDREVCVARKHSVEMCADNGQRRQRSTAHETEAIALFIDLDFRQSELNELLLQILGA